MSIYRDILVAARDLLAAEDDLKPMRITIRKRPEFVQLQDALPQLVIAPRPDLAEQVDSLQFGNSCVLTYDAYFGIFTDARWDDERFLARLDWRETVRLALWDPLRLGLAALGEFDVDYDPSPQGMDPPPPNVEALWQLFRYKVKTARARAT